MGELGEPCLCVCVCVCLFVCSFLVDGLAEPALFVWCLFVWLLDGQARPRVCLFLFACLRDGRVLGQPRLILHLFACLMGS
jgi:hypothetical protein